MTPDPAPSPPPASAPDPSGPSTDTDDPVISSYNIHLTNSDVPRLVLQFLDRDPNNAYDDAHGQKPSSLRLKPQSGLLEVDVPITTRVNYDIPKGLRYGDALRRSRVGGGGSSGGFGMAGGFSGGGGGGGGITAAAGGAGPGAKVKNEPDAMMEDKSESAAASLLRNQTLGGRIKVPEEGDPVYMLATFRDGLLPSSLVC